MAGASLAIGQRSLGDRSKLFPLLPVLTEGCPATSDAEMQYPLEIDYAYDRVDPALFDQPPLPGLARWAPLLPPLAPGLDLGEGGTALVPADDLGRALGFTGRLLLKDESRNPTWSHKDRLNLCTVSTAILSGAPGIAVASSGNHGAAAAAFAARAGLPCVVVTSEGPQPSFRRLLAALGAHVVLTDADNRWPVLRRIVAATGFMPASNLTRFHTGNPYGPEGYKTIAYELFLQLGRRVPDSVLVPTGYAELLYGLAKGFRELRLLGLADRVPQLLSAEPAARGPLARAAGSNAAAMEVAPEPSAAAGIACTVGGYRGIVALQESHGRALTCSEAGMAEMQARLARHGYYQEISGAAGLAAGAEVIARGEKLDGIVVAILTSTGLKDGPMDVSDVPVCAAEEVEALIARLQAEGETGAP
ncbi:pyridoxal-phosphate dependent enzyme [Marinibaculum pumilum]|uniref:Pyridoxal-phosphate dependent enzyme n=1 Tax=Marinibaculum pumilum TaxID=1766165 RepID=A0ABV7L0A5_9PROT